MGKNYNFIRVQSDEASYQNADINRNFDTLKKWLRELEVVLVG